MEHRSFRGIRAFCLLLCLLTGLAIFHSGNIMAKEEGSAAFEALIRELADEGVIPGTNGTVISLGDYTDEMAELGFYRLTPLGEASRFVLSVHLSWGSATRTPNPMNSGCGLFFLSESGTLNHLMVSLRMDGLYYLSGYRGTGKLNYIKKPHALPQIDGEADLVLVVNDAHMMFFINGDKVIEKEDLPVMGDVFGTAVLSGTNMDYGIRCTGQDMFVFTW